MLAAFAAETPKVQGTPTSRGIFVFLARDPARLSPAYDYGINPLLSWAELEPSEGVYNWAPLDHALNQASLSGKKAVPRVYTNASVVSQATPDWFFAIPNAQRYYSSPQARASGFEAPVPWDPVYQEKFGNFLRALGQRYNGHPAIEFFQTNAGGGLYGEIVLTGANMFPPGWTVEVQKTAIVRWLDRWLESFPDTRLSLMINPVGYGIAEDAATYAANRGVYLQQNSPVIQPAAAAIFRQHQQRTGIVLEVENACRTARGAAFDQMMEAVFNHQIAIDYLVICNASLTDYITSTKLPSIVARLRPQQGP
jgi:hypothetical protein